MRLSYVILADAAESTSNGKFSLLGGGIETIFAPAFPTVQPGLAIVAKLLASAPEAEQELELHIEITGPNEYHAPLGDVRFKSVPVRGTSENTAINLIINMQVLRIPEPGSYTLHFSVDDQEIGMAPLTAQQLDPGEISSATDQRKW
jgi:Family of unknown function (DUF6941)